MEYHYEGDLDAATTHKMVIDSKKPKKKGKLQLNLRSLPRPLRLPSNLVSHNWETTRESWRNLLMKIARIAGGCMLGGVESQ